MDGSILLGFKKIIRVEKEFLSLTQQFTRSCFTVKIITISRHNKSGNLNTFAIRMLSFGKKQKRFDSSWVKWTFSFVFNIYTHKNKLIDNYSISQMIS